MWLAHAQTGRRKTVNHVTTANVSIDYAPFNVLLTDCRIARPSKLPLTFGPLPRNPCHGRPYTGPLPPPIIIPRSANTPTGAIAALINFLRAPPSSTLRHENARNEQTVLLTGAGLSVASGLADYRGDNGTYRLNKTYRPIYYNEFVSNHESRKRYWARSFLGWNNLNTAKPNAAHYAIRDLGNSGHVSSVITQNVDSFHGQAHPDLDTLELHGYLRAAVCLSCRSEYPRREFQAQLAKMNPAWKAFLDEMVISGALATEDPDERRKKGLRTNPDGDVELPEAPFHTFRYPACPVCLKNPPPAKDGSKGIVRVDDDGAWQADSNVGILKPAVIMFGESISAEVKRAAEKAVNDASRILILGSSLATYSALRLVKLAKENGMPIGILNMGGVRAEETFFQGLNATNDGSAGVRCSNSLEKMLPEVVKELRRLR